MHTRRKRERDKAAPDLTPMIDVTFQLLIFFILCTRFIDDEEFHRADLPKEDGIYDEVSPPKEQLTIYCNWNEDTGTNSYVVAIDARGRKPVENSLARLDELVIFPGDSNAQIKAKQDRYEIMFNSLVSAAENYIQNSGARIERIEIAFAKDSAMGASSGTAPWMFVSAALDASVEINARRKDAEQEPLSVAFKFVDALGSYSR